MVYGRIGLCNQEFGTLASWLVDVVNILTGHFDRRAALMFAQAGRLARMAAPTARAPTACDARPLAQRVAGAPEVLGQVPVSCLAEEIDTPGRRARSGR